VNPLLNDGKGIGSSGGIFPRREFLFMLSLVLFAFFLRFMFLGRESLWIDEVMTSVRADMSFIGMIRSIAQRDHLPLYYSLMWSWVRIFGSSGAALRSLSAVAGSLAVIPLYLIGRRRGSKEALLVGMVGASLPTLVYFGQEAKMYSLLVLLSSVSFLSFLELLSPSLMRRRTASTILLVSNTCLVYTHYYSFLFITAEALALFMFLRKKEGTVKKGFSGLFGIGWPLPVSLLMSLPWWIFLLKEGYLFSLSTGGGMSLTPWNILSAVPFLLGAYRVPTGLDYAPMVIVVLLMLSALALSLFKRGGGLPGLSDELLLSVPVILFTFAASLLISVFLINIYGSRYFLVLSPLLLFLSVLPLVKGRMGKVRDGVLVSVILFSLIANGVQYQKIEKEDWRGAVSFVEDHWEDGDVVIPVPFWERYSIGYYGPDLEMVYASNAEDLDRNVIDSGRMWLILREARDDGWTLEHLGERFGAPLMTRNFRGLTVHLFEAE